MNNIKRWMHRTKWSLFKPYYEEYIKPNSRILDIGAGDLHISKLMQDELKCKVIGIDIMDYGTDFVEHYLIEDYKLPFADNSFDYATFNDCLHHIPKEGQIKLIKEANRIAKDKILILEDAKRVLSFIFEFITNRPSMPKPLTHRTREGWGKFFLNNFNFKSVDLMPIFQPFWYPLKHYIFVLDKYEGVSGNSSQS